MLRSPSGSLSAATTVESHVKSILRKLCENRSDFGPRGRRPAG
jgi:hypothetical protein